MKRRMCKSHVQSEHMPHLSSFLKRTPCGRHAQELGPLVWQEKPLSFSLLIDCCNLTSLWAEHHHNGSRRVQPC